MRSKEARPGLKNAASGAPEGAASSPGRLRIGDGAELSTVRLSALRSPQFNEGTKGIPARPRRPNNRAGGAMRIRRRARQSPVEQRPEAIAKTFRDGCV
jgi:hypothetical protein